jgi:hypothetical protein
VNKLVIDEILDPHTIVVEGITYAAHPYRDCGVHDNSVCAFFSRTESCHTIPCLANQMRKLGNNDRKDVIWLEKA